MSLLDVIFKRHKPHEPSRELLEQRVSSDQAIDRANRVLNDRLSRDFQEMEREVARRRNV